MQQLPEATGNEKGRVRVKERGSKEGYRGAISEAEPTNLHTGKMKEHLLGFETLGGSLGSHFS